jgi:non-heme chloroperoxidase
MKTIAVGLAVLVVLVVGVAGAVLAFDAPTPPAPMASVDTALDHVDFRDLPPKLEFFARDGTKLAYREYQGDPADIVVLVHGSSGTSASMHVLAEAIHAHGPTVYALAMRGHDGTGRSGDIDYVGQLDDDVVDFMQQVPPKSVVHATLLGFSSGGGFVLRFAGGPNGALFDRYVLVSPQMPPGSPLMRPNGGGWVSVAIPRFVILTFLSRSGIHTFDYLPVIAFAVTPGSKIQTAQYSFRMLENFGPRSDYLGDLRRVPRPVSLFAGSRDEIFYSDRYNSTLRPVRPDLALTLIPGMDHMDMIVKPEAVSAIAASFTPAGGQK